MQFKWKCIDIYSCVYKWETENNICITSKRKYIRGYYPDIEYKSWSRTVLLCMGLVIHLTICCEAKRSNKTDTVTINAIKTIKFWWFK